MEHNEVRNQTFQAYSVFEKVLVFQLLKLFLFL